MDVGSFISQQISQIAQSSTSRLGFPALITALCDIQGVVSNTLIFESLNPAINLAYVKKNCWNPADPSITFPGARRTRTSIHIRGTPYFSAFLPATTASASIHCCTSRHAGADAQVLVPGTTDHHSGPASLVPPLTNGSAAHDSGGLSSAGRLARRPALH